MEVIYLVGGLTAGGIIGYVLGNVIFKSRLAKVENDLGRENDILQTRFDELVKDLAMFETKLKDETSRRESAELQNASMRSDYENLNEKLETERKQVENLQKKFQIEFENIANKILKEHTFEFNQVSTKNMGDLLNPLKEKISNFEKKVEDTYNKGLKDQTDLKAELKKLYDLSIALDKDAKDLTKALKADTKKQGNWGEVILERVLERSGLIKDQEYYLQFTGKSEEGITLRPDVVIKLPEEKHLVIDSKVSLNAYTEYAASETETEKKAALKKHLDSVKKHVKELSDKNYSAILNINSPDFVMMFLPIEPAFGIAVQTDHDLFNYAWQRKVVIVSPTTLLATLRTVASIWKYEKQSQNALEIAKRGGLLYDKFVGFVKDFEIIGKSLDRAGEAYKEGFKKLKKGDGDLAWQAEQLKSMGVTTKKNIPVEFLEDGE